MALYGFLTSREQCALRLFQAGIKACVQTVRNGHPLAAIAATVREPTSNSNAVEKRENSPFPHPKLSRFPDVSPGSARRMNRSGRLIFGGQKRLRGITQYLFQGIIESRAIPL
jgi:hypothetical protein